MRPVSTRTTSPARGTPMHERIHARRRKVHHELARRRRRRVYSALALTVLVAAAVVAVRSPLFAVTEVRVAGVGADRRPAVLEASGLRPGDNLLLADLRDAEEGVTRLSWVREVDARRRPPSIVELHVIPREPDLVLVAGATAWLVDSEGVVLGGGARAGLPRLTADHLGAPVVGQAVEDEAVANALAVHAALPGPLRTLVLAYVAPSVHGLRVLLDSGRPGDEQPQIWVRFGAAERSEAKARVIGLLLERARGEAGAFELDVRAPDNPVLVPVPPGQVDGGDA